MRPTPRPTGRPPADEPAGSAIDPVPGQRNLPPAPAPLIVCGRFEGVDQRVIEARELEEVSIGDYVLSGGEIAAMALIDACVRLLPGVMGKTGIRRRRRVSPKAYWNTLNIPARRSSRAARSRKS